MRKLEDKIRSTMRRAAATQMTASHKIGILHITQLHPCSWDNKQYRSVRNHCAFFFAARLKENVASQSIATNTPMTDFCVQGSIRICDNPALSRILDVCQGAALLSHEAQPGCKADCGGSQRGNGDQHYSECPGTQPD